MEQKIPDNFRRLCEYHCPRYEELPHIALYKDQVVSVLNEAVSPFYPHGETPVTATMVNNYVKMKLLSPPEKKKYSTEQIACLYVIFLLKQVLSISEIAALLHMQQSCDFTDAKHLLQQKYHIQAGDLLCRVFLFFRRAQQLHFYIVVYHGGGNGCFSMRVKWAHGLVQHRHHLVLIKCDVRQLFIARAVILAQAAKIIRYFLFHAKSLHLVYSITPGHMLSK